MTDICSIAIPTVNLPISASTFTIGQPFIGSPDLNSYQTAGESLEQWLPIVDP